MCVLQRTNFFGLQTFLALSYFELNTLAFSQRFEAVTNDLPEVSEHVWAAVFLSDKAEAFLIVEPLNGTGSCRHTIVLTSQMNIASSQGIKARSCLLLMKTKTDTTTGNEIYA